MQQYVIGVIDPKKSIYYSLKKRLNAAYQVIAAADFTSALKLFPRQTLLAVIIHWELIEERDLTLIQQLKHQFRHVPFILFARPMRNELGITLGQMGIDRFIEFGDWDCLLKQIEELRLNHDFKINLSDFGIEFNASSFWVKKVLRIMQTDFLKLKTTDRIAARLGISTSHLHNNFVRETGFTCKQLLNGFKAYYCVWWMEHSQLLLKEIAVKARFLPTNNFSRFFKNATGIQPAFYRKKYDYSDFPKIFIQHTGKKLNKRKNNSTK